MNEPKEIIPGLVSVVICAYNNWPDVELTIASALQQSYQPLEVIVIDNSSADATPEEVPRRFGQRVRYIRQPNRGDAGAYNAGFAVARGEFLQFVDGDDVLAPHKIAKQVAVFRADPHLDIVYGDYRMFQTHAGEARWKDVATQLQDDWLQALIIPRRDWVGIGALGTLFHRRVLEKVGTWDESLYISDWDYWLRAAWAGCRFGHCPGALMGFKRIRPGQMHQNASAMSHGREALWSKALGYITMEPYRSEVRAALARTRFRMAIDLPGLSRRGALTKLAEARAASRETISPLAYLLALGVVVIPGARQVLCQKWMGRVRSLAARLASFRSGRFRWSK